MNRVFLLCVILLVVDLSPRVFANDNNSVKKIVTVYDSAYSEDGWNKLHEESRAGAETHLIAKNYSATFFPHPAVRSDAEAYDIMHARASEGADLFVVHNIRFANATRTIARDFPGAHFMATPSVGIFNGNATYNMYYNMYEGTWLAGMICGRMTKNNKVGIVALKFWRGQNTYNNAFYLGVKHVNPNAQVYVIQIDDVSGAVQESKAAELLANDYGIDCGVGGSLASASQTWSELGIQSVGLFGQSRYVVDDTVLAVVSPDWYSQYVKGIEGHLNGSWPGGEDDWGGFDSGSMVIRDFSPRLPADVRRLVSREVSRIASGEEKIFCGARIAAAYPGIGSGCLTSAQIRTMSTWLPGLINPRNLTYNESIVLVFMRASEPYPIALYVLVCLALIGLMALVVLVAKNKEKRMVIRASPVFLLLIILGSGMMLTSVFFMFGEMTFATCQARLWLFALGFVIAYSSVTVEAVRIYVIFRNDSMEVFSISNGMLIVCGVLPLVAVMIILLGIWTGVAPYSAMTLKLSENLKIGEFDLTCSTNSSAMAIIVVIYVAIVLLATCFIAIKSRNLSTKSKLSKEYNKSSRIGVACLATFIMGVAMAATNIGTRFSATSHALVFSLPALIIPVFLVGSIFWPIVSATFRGELDKSTTATGSGTSGAKSRVTSSSSPRRTKTTDTDDEDDDDEAQSEEAVDSDTESSSALDDVDV